MSELDREATTSSVQHYRQEDFHQIFLSVANEERLIDTFACALSREILLQGRLFLGEKHVCFHANILGWITNVVIALEDIVLIERKNTALLFPNAILISTLHHRYFFASFLFREQAFSRLLHAWKSAVDHEKDDFSITDTSLFLSEEPRIARKLELDQIPSSSLFVGLRPDQDDFEYPCNGHLSEAFIHIPFPGSNVAKVSSILFENGGERIMQFHLDSTDSYSVSLWSTSSSGLEQRSGEFTFKGKRGNLYRANFTETYVTSRPNYRTVVEASLNIKGIAGKSCNVLIRYFLLSKGEGSYLCITFDAVPAPDVLFKESFRKLIICDLHRYFIGMRDFLLKTSGDFGTCESSLSLHMNIDRRSSSGSVQVYFDRAAFLKSSLGLLLIIFLSVLVVYLSRAWLGPKMLPTRLSSSDLEKRLAQIMRELSDQLAIRLLRKEQVKRKLAELLKSASNVTE